eukprot:3269497-Pyramimonas_sp.AAC.1
MARGAEWQEDVSFLSPGISDVCVSSRRGAPGEQPGSSGNKKSPLETEKCTGGRTRPNGGTEERRGRRRS